MLENQPFEIVNWRGEVQHGSHKGLERGRADGIWTVWIEPNAVLGGSWPFRGPATQIKCPMM